ncbi:putative lipoprotein [Vulgatibacter incomptus]|uniref:Putative lipoprotein n=1 Tax=Vulgatibacter incomptus TaxID=1391653 RepID=A0A0K1P9P1_9BACT|nr:putative lipoprotein [Vulgatibacter incomptus]
MASALLAACGGTPDGVIDSCKSGLELPPGVSTDILFVIDNSGSMASKQARVMAELESFVSALVEGPVANDFQVGVVTTGVTMHAALCDPEQAPYLYRYEKESGRLQPAKDERGAAIEGPRVLAWNDPDFVENFRGLIAQGTKGSGQEMGLEAMRLALSEPLVSATGPGGNAGILRPGSRLLVVIVSDEDDCSDPTGKALVLRPPCPPDLVCSSDAQCEEGAYCLADGDHRICMPNACDTAEGRARLEPVERYVDFLRGLDDGTGKGRKRETFLAVIGSVALEAPHDPERCMAGSPDEPEGVAVRYREAVRLMGESGYVDSICNESYGTALRQIAGMVSAPHVLELPQAPLDGRLLQVDVRRTSGETQRCRVGDGFSYEPATATSRARVTLEGACRLQHGDQIELRLICAG